MARTSETPGGVIAAKIVFGLALMVAAWTLVASLVFLLGTGLYSAFAHPFWQWWLYFIYAPPNPQISLWLKIGAGAGGVVVLVFLAAALTRRRAIGPSLRRSIFSRSKPPMRGVTDNHGHAEWMTMTRAAQLFPGPDPDHGGVAIGEAYRVDEDKVAGEPFRPKDPKTWGQGGKAPLLVDPCEDGSTHSLVIAGSGSFKTTAAVTTYTTWRAPIVTLDPSSELGPMLRPMREAMGHTVHEISLGGGVGFNVLDWIDIDSPEAITNIQDVVSWICAESSHGSKEANAEFFDRQGRNLVTCLLVHMMFDPDLPAELKTLRHLRRGISTPQDQLREALKAIHEHSPASYARETAGALMGLVDDTFSGIYGNADDKTSWLSNPAFGDLVSGTTFRSSDLCSGKVDVFIQLPLRALENTPEVGKALVGALLNSVYEADGAVAGRVLFLLDEVARLGPMKIITTARDAGRKYGITLRLLYQSTGQIEGQWGKDGKKAWYDSVVHRTYVAVSDLETAKELSETFGTYGVMATSEGSNTGSSGKGFESSNRSRGANTSYHEISRPLIRPEELMNDVRVDESFIVVRGGRPLRCGVPIYFRRPDVAERVGQSQFSKGRASA
ncbi:type IV secretory system conjugative DNA transfer family protein [Endobacter medicaginis]